MSVTINVMFPVEMLTCAVAAVLVEVPGAGAASASRLLVPVCGLSLIAVALSES